MKISVIIGLLTLVSGPTFADTIQIQPGQCIMVGTQQVCSAKHDECIERTRYDHQKIISKAVCRYGAAYENDKTLKGYGLYIVRMGKKENSKNETLLKTFSPAQKAECESAAETYRDE